jgi:dipeptidyl aminopeptidase/acylaminoacyl peptidase
MCRRQGILPLLIGKASSSFNQDLWLLNLSNGATQYLTPHSADARYEAAFAPDGRHLYVASDLDRDFLTLAHMELTTADADNLAPHLVFRDSLRWDVLSLYVTPRTSRLTYHVNTDGYTRLVIESLSDGSVLPITGLPPGVCELSAFRSDGLQAAVTVNAPGYNPDVWVADLTTGKARQVTRSSRAGIPQASLVEPELLRYAGFDGLSIASFLYRPRTVRPGDTLRVLFIVHGGPESQTQPTFGPVTQYFVNRGYAVFAPNVRGATGYGKRFAHLDDVDKRPDAVADLAYGARYLIEQGIADPQRIAVYGGSYGGFMVLAALTQQTWPQPPGSVPWRVPVWSAGVVDGGITARLRCRQASTSCQRTVAADHRSVRARTTPCPRRF